MRGEPLTSGLGKPERRSTVKARATRHAAKRVKSVRALCVERDGDCRFGDWEQNPHDWHADALEVSPCDGPVEWAHLGKKKRYKTRGQAPETRHTTAGSLMLCRKHHRTYDAGEMRIEALDDDQGADGLLAFHPAYRLNQLAAKAKQLKALAKGTQ